MARRSPNQLGPLENEVMALVWQASAPLPVRDVLETLNEARTRKNQLAYTTVMTVLSRLAEKGALHRTAAGRGYVYEADAEDEAGMAVNTVLRDYGDAALARLVDAARADPKVMRRLQRLLRNNDEAQPS